MTTSHILKSSAAAAALFCVAIVPAAATTSLPPFSAAVTCGPGDPFVGTHDATCSTLDITPDGTFSTHSEGSFDPKSSVFAEADASDDEVSSEATASLQYLVEVVGPGLNTNGPLPQVIIDMSSEGSTGGSGEAELIGDIPGHYACSGGACNQIAPATWDASESFQWSAGIPFSVGMFVDADSGLGAPLNSFARIDPHFSIDPATPDASQWSFIFSDGISNGPVLTGVPEPASWTMLLLGLVFAGLAYRRSAKSAQ